MSMESLKRKLGVCYLIDDELGGGTDLDGKEDINIDFGSGDDLGDEDGGDDKAFVIPDEYKDRDYAKGLKSNDDVWKMLDNAQKKIGEKTIVAGIPGENATEEEIKNFNKLWGVPEKAEDYKIEADEAMTTMYGEEDKVVLGQFKELLHKAGANEKQAAILKDGYTQIITGIIDAKKAEIAEADKQFDELVAKTFGDRQDKVLDNAKKLINEFAPEGFKDRMHTIPSEQLVVLAGVLDGIREKYIEEDQLSGGSGTSSGMTIESARAEIQKVIGSEEFNNPMHAKHDIAKQEFVRLSGILDSLKKN